MLIVFLLWVMMMNWVCDAHLAHQFGEAADVRLVQRRVHLVENAERAGRYWKMPTSSASAVSAFSPPESSSTFCSFLPGGEATTSMPLSAEFSWSVSLMNAWPPPNSLLKVLPEVLVDDGEGLVELLPRDDSISLIVFCVFSIDPAGPCAGFPGTRGAAPSPCIPRGPSCSPGPCFPGGCASHVGASSAASSSPARRARDSSAISSSRCCAQLLHAGLGQVLRVGLQRGACSAASSPRRSRAASSSARAVFSASSSSASRARTCSTLPAIS